MAAEASTPGRPQPHLVQDLEFRHPAYLPTLAILLVVLVATSSALALASQPIDGLVPGWLEAITAVDLALSGVILLLLIGVAVRAGLHLHRRAGYRLPSLRRRG